MLRCCNGSWDSCLNRLSIGGTSYVYNVGKTADASARSSQLSQVLCMTAENMTAYPAAGAKIYWISDGGLRLLAAKASEAAGYKSAETLHQEWVETVRKAFASPALAEMTTSTTAVRGRFGNAVVNATEALAVEYLATKYSAESLLTYFKILRDINDGQRAFQQAFGVSPETFAPISPLI